MSQADLAIKAALILGGVALAVYVTRKAATAVSDAAGQALQAVNPWNQENVIYQTANSAVQAITGNQNDTLGVVGWELLNWDRSDSRFYREPPPPIPVTPTTPGGALQNDYGTNFIYF